MTRAILVDRNSAYTIKGLVAERRIAQEHREFTNFLATIPKNIKSEADDIIEYRKTANLLLREVNLGCKAFNSCFPVTDAITSEYSNCYYWAKIDAAPLKKVMEGDTFVNNKSQPSKAIEESIMTTDRTSRSTLRLSWNRWGSNK